MMLAGVEGLGPYPLVGGEEAGRIAMRIWSSVLLGAVAMLGPNPELVACAPALLISQRPDWVLEHAPAQANLGQEGQLRQNMGQHANIRSIRIEKAQIIPLGNDWQEGPRRETDVTIFDEKGNKREESHQEGRSWRCMYEYSYDVLGNITEMQQRCEGGPPSFRRRYTYDGVRLTGEQDVTLDGRSLGHRTKSYDDGGRVREELSFRGDESLEMRAISFFDGPIRTIEQTFYDQQGSGAYGITSRYNERGQPLESASHAGIAGGHAGSLVGGGVVAGGASVPPNSIISRTSFDYDSLGRLTATRTFGPDGALRQELTVAYGDGPLKGANWSRREQVIYGPGGSIVSREERRVEAVDANGNPTKVRVLSWNKTMQSYQPAEVLYSTYKYYD